MTLVKLLIGFVAAGALSATAWHSLRDTFAQSMFARKNYRGIDVPVGVGVLIPITVMMVVGAFTFIESVANVAPVSEVAALHLLVLAGGFSLLGLIDDIAAHGDDRGFRGHLTAMAHGRLTTGGLKLVVGGFLSIAVAATTVSGGWWRVLIAGIVISLAANLANLFDRAPGRTSKVALIAAVPLFVLCDAGHRAGLVGVAIVLGAMVGLLAFDLREELMLGDAGSNVIGATLGFGLVVSSGLTTWIVALVVLAALNVLSERISFSRVIDAVAPLRAIDRVGRRR